MFEYTEYNIDDKITKLELLKPNEQSLGEILNAKNKVTTLTLGGVSQLTFDIPDATLFSNVMLNRDDVTGSLLDLDVNESTQNNQAKNTLVKYLIRATYTNGKQIIFVLPSKNINSDMSTVGLSVQCYSREYELASSILINYIGVPIGEEYVLDGLSLEEVLTDILQDTLWEIDFLDSGFKNIDANVIRRTVDAFNNVSKLAAIDSLMNVFGGIPEYDTVTRKISVYKPDNEQHYKFNGLEINDYNYLKEVSKQEQTDNLITRLYGLGKDGITINGISPTGTSYIEDLSFFLYPAEMNELEQLITPSYYMSSGLALAELKYEKFLQTQTGLLNILFNEKGILQTELTTLLNELYVLQTNQKIKEDQVDLKVGLGEANLDNAQYVQILGELDAINLSVENKETEIENKRIEINNKTDEINVIYDSLKLENHFTVDELKERQLYIYEGLYTNTGIAVETDLYDEMVEYIKKYNTPNITINIGVKDIFAMQTKQARKDRNKIQLGEQINIYYKKGILEIDIKAQIMEVKIDEENKSIGLVISNILDYKKNADDWISKILQRNITTSTIVDTNKVNWNSGKIAYDDINKIYQEGIDTAKIEINSAVNNSVKTDSRGITVTDTTNPLRFVRVTNGVIALSKDGGRTFSTAISADGVWAERLVGQILIGNELEIIGDNGTLKIGAIPQDTYPDLNDEDFGIVLNSTGNRIFISRERGFKITTPTGVLMLEGNPDGIVRARNMEILSNDATGNRQVMSGDRILQTWQDSMSDSLDSSYPMYQYLYLPPETKEIRRAFINVRALRFRSYSTTTQGGGGNSQSVTSGGGGGAYVAGSSGRGETAHNHVIQVQRSNTSASNLASLGYRYLMLQPSGAGDAPNCNGNYNNMAVLWAASADGNAVSSCNFITWCTENGHYHNVSIPSHSHDVSVNFPDHTHSLTFGIYQTNYDIANIELWVNGVKVGNTFSGNQDMIDIKNYLTINYNNVIMFTCSNLGRIQSTVFVQAMIGVS